MDNHRTMNCYFIFLTSRSRFSAVNVVLFSCSTRVSCDAIQRITLFKRDNISALARYHIHQDDIFPFLHFILHYTSFLFVHFSDEVACQTAESCFAACGNPKGCADAAYPKLLLALMPTGEIQYHGFICQCKRNCTSLHLDTSRFDFVYLFKTLKLLIPWIQLNIPKCETLLHS